MADVIAAIVTVANNPLTSFGEITKHGLVLLISLPTIGFKSTSQTSKRLITIAILCRPPHQ